MRLDPAKDGEEKLGTDLEAKAALLLSAQGHYLRAIRIGNPDWAVAAGYRIGELYDEMHVQMTRPRPRPASTPSTRPAYRDELRRKVRVLVTKAIAIYESTLATARRTGVENRFVAEDPGVARAHEAGAARRRGRAARSRAGPPGRGRSLPASRRRTARGRPPLSRAAPERPGGP